MWWWQFFFFFVAICFCYCLCCLSRSVVGGVRLFSCFIIASICLFFQRGCVLVLCFVLNCVMDLRFVCGAGSDVVFLLFVFVVVCVVAGEVSVLV